MSNDPRTDIDVISGISQGKVLAHLSEVQQAGGYAASDSAAEGYLSGVTTWLLASVGPEQAYKVLTRYADKVAAEMAEIAAEHKQRERN